MMKKRKQIDEKDLNSSEIKHNENPDSDNDDKQQQQQQDLTKLLQPFNKQQLVQILQNAANSSNNSQILNEIHRAADSHFAHRKLFIDGLNRDTTTAPKLREFFSKYGHVEDSIVSFDNYTGKSRGFGFVLFKHRESARRALKDRLKWIDGRFVDCYLASGEAGHSQEQRRRRSESQRKIFVGNVKSCISAGDLVAFFSRFGEIEKGPTGFDSYTGKSRGYAFFLYRTVEGARKALEEPVKYFNGVPLLCEKFIENHQKVKDSSSSSSVLASHGGASHTHELRGFLQGLNFKAVFLICTFHIFFVVFFLLVFIFAT